MEEVLSPRPRTQGPLEVPLHPKLILRKEATRLETAYLEAANRNAQQLDEEKEILTLFITEQDRYWSQRNGTKNPILCALQRTTSTIWRMDEDGFAVEVMPPYRVCQLPPDVVAQWRQFEQTGQMEGCEWELELQSTQEPNAVALVQHFQTKLREKLGKARVQGRIDWVG